MKSFFVFLSALLLNLIAVNAQNVGIGTTTPSQPLSFANTQGGKISFFKTGTTHYGIGMQGAMLQVYTPNPDTDILFGWGSSESFNEKFRITGSGLVGIGTEYPSATLDVRRTTDVTANFFGSVAISHFNYGLDEHTYIRGGKAGANVLLNDFAGAGNVGIGTSMPGHTLDISANSTQDKVHIRLFENDIDYTRMRFMNSNVSNYWDMMVVSNPHTNSAALYNFYYSGFGQNVLSLRGDGSATLRGTLTQLSDERLKQNIRRIENPLQQLLQLNGYHYEWIDTRMDRTMQSGVIAQEVKALFPYLVKEDEKGMLSVNYTGLIPLLIVAIKSQQQQIDELKKAVGK